MRCRLAIILILVFVKANLSQTIHAEEQGTWVKCFGEAAVQNITTEEAQVLAKRRARLDAIEKVCGISIQAESMIKNFRLAADFIHSISYGQVVEERNPEWKTEALPPEDPSSPPVIVFKFTMEARVIPLNGKPDPYFKVRLNINRTVFQTGDEAILKVRATKDCYLTVLSLAANDSVYILVPNQFNPDCFVKAGVKIEIPDKKLREQGFNFRVATLPGHKKDTEIIKVIATKQKLAFLDEVSNTGGFGLLGTPRMAVTKLARWLSEIPVSERAESSMIYSVYSKDK